MDKNAIEELEKTLRGLLHGEFSSLTISFNEEHAPNYLKAHEYDDYNRETRGDWISDDEKKDALDNNSVWSAQWYQKTPIGFNCIYASSLYSLIEALKNE